MLRIGLTGGIGSGKTTVAHIFEVIGVPVYFTDSEGKRLMNEKPEVKKAIIDTFGEKSYKGAEINRSFLIEEVYTNDEKLQLLNQIVHPAVFENAAEWMEKQKTPYAIKEAAIIFESGSDRFLDYVIGVSAPEVSRIARLKERDGKSEDEIRFWMDKQMDASEKMSRCDFIIYNDEKQLLIPQVLSLHEKLLALSKTH